ncbi:MAG: S8 family peptidase, partial [Cyanobacteria bacterium REEB65]|nr:S8 family peptidase [Cyanobacteria bacterium REEB65]
GTLAATILTGCGSLIAPQISNGGVQTSSLMNGQAIPGEYIVQLAAGSQTTVPGAVSTLDFGSGGKFVLVRKDGLQLGDLQSQLGTNPDVKGIQPNTDVQVPVEQAQPQPNLPSFSTQALAAPNDPLYANQWFLPHIGADKAWTVTKGQGVVVAIVDTGVDYNHPDLAAHIISHGYSFVTNQPDALDTFGHGTHCAGIAAAIQNNGIGVSGVAPEARILPVQVLGPNGGGSLYAIAQGIKYATDYGTQNHVHVVMNLSLGGPASDDSVTYTAGWYATTHGALPVAAAGNSNTAVGTPAMWNQFYMPVSAIDQNDQKASFSNFGPEISVGAPGVQIFSTTPTYDVPLNQYGYPKYYSYLQGTSMACPVVTGTCALVWSAHPTWTWQQVRSQVEKTAKQIQGPQGSHNNVYGYGLVQAGAAVGAN